MKIDRLEIVEWGDLPMIEISGLGQTRSPYGDELLLAVADDSFTIVAVDIDELTDDQVEEYAITEYDVEEVIGEGQPPYGSQWEAADGEAAGRIFILQESPGKVFVLTPDFEDLLHSIELTLDSPAGRDLEWDHDPNAQGEGLVLLANGHLLVAKEKDPCLLMEFGPRGAKPLGVSPDLTFRTEAEWPLPECDSSTQELLKVWSYTEEAAAYLKDVSDLTPGPDGRLYVLSDESRAIIRLQERLEPGDEVCGADAVWELPEEIEQPEGLVISDDMIPIVAVDKGQPEDNIFILEPLQD
ncbi:hypothetical protein BH18ACT15_BH18ACT15_08760 [soil metagenome]